MKTIDSFSGEYRWLSNFWPVEVEYEAIVYPSTEHAYQAAKTLNTELRQIIAALPTAAQSKKAGAKVDIREDWEEVKVSVMLDLLHLKFQHPDLAQKLIDTGDALLVEGNYWGDRFWGVCRGEGRNILGNLLMRVRKEIVNGQH